MKNRIASLLVGMFVGVVLFGGGVGQAQGPTTEERLQKLESVVDGDTSTVTGGVFRTAASGARVEIGALSPERIFFYNNAGARAATITGLDAGMYIEGGFNLHLASQKIGFYGVTPVARPTISFLNEAATDAQAIRRINQLLKKLGNLGLVRIKN